MLTVISVKLSSNDIDSSVLILFEILFPVELNGVTEVTCDKRLFNSVA